MKYSTRPSTRLYVVPYTGIALLVQAMLPEGFPFSHFINYKEMFLSLTNANPGFEFDSDLQAKHNIKHGDNKKMKHVKVLSYAHNSFNKTEAAIFPMHTVVS